VGRLRPGTENKTSPARRDARSPRERRERGPELDERLHALGLPRVTLRPPATRSPTSPRGRRHGRTQRTRPRPASHWNRHHLEQHPDEAASPPAIASYELGIGCNRTPADAVDLGRRKRPKPANSTASTKVTSHSVFATAAGSPAGRTGRAGSCRFTAAATKARGLGRARRRQENHELHCGRNRLADRRPAH